jgi:oligosaccharide repeat unit polymerase
MIFSIALYALLVAGMLLYAWQRTGDVLHPAVVILPQFLFIYAFMPLMILSIEDEQRFIWFNGSEEAVITYQLIAALLTVSFAVGIFTGARRRPDSSVIIDLNPNILFVFALLCGIASFAISIIAMYSAGGLQAAYGQAYGGVYIREGYLSEARNLCLVAVPLLLLARKRDGMRATDWLLALAFLSPIILQGVLGARRGPTVLAIFVLFGGYLIIFHKRISLAVLLIGGACVAYLLLLMVSNRNNIFLGSDFELNQGAFSILADLHGNEYVYGNAIVRYVNETGDVFHGRRVIAHLIGQSIPSELWPAKYEDLADYFGLEDLSLKVNAGVPLIRIANVVGWIPPIGAAPTFAAELWLEFGWLSSLVALLIGFLYGNAWIRAKQDSSRQPFYVLLLALSVFLVTQSLEAWTHRLILFGLPALILGSASARKFVRLTSYR